MTLAPNHAFIIQAGASKNIKVDQAQRQQSNRLSFCHQVLGLKISNPATKIRTQSIGIDFVFVQEKKIDKIRFQKCVIFL